MKGAASTVLFPPSAAADAPVVDAIPFAVNASHVSAFFACFPDDCVPPGFGSSAALFFAFNASFFSTLSLRARSPAKDAMFQSNHGHTK